MAISFNTIPNILYPPGAYIEYDSSRAVQGVPALPTVVLLIGSRLSTGSVPELEFRPITRRNDGIEFFGRGSQLHHMIEKFKAANPLVELWAIAQDDDAGAVAAEYTITVTGPATEAGTIALLVGGRQVNIAVSDGDIANDIAAAIDAAINADLDLPVTSSVALAVVTVTARHAAEFGNDIDLRDSYFPGQELPSGVTLAYAQTVVGTTNPDVADVIAVLPEQWFTTICSGYNDAANMLLLEAQALAQWGPLDQRDVMILTAFPGLFAAVSAYGAARNSQFSSVMASNTSPNPFYEWAAVYAAVEAGEPDPARPRQTLRLPGLLAPDIEDRFIFSERNILLDGGIATHIIDQAGNVSIERAVTTYQTNALGVDDTTFLDITTLRTLSALRYTLRVRISTKYPRHKLADNGTRTGPGQPIVTPDVIRGEILALFTDWELLGWVEGFQQFSDELIVERNAMDPNRVDAQLGPNLINQFRVFAGQIQFLV